MTRAVPAVGLAGAVLAIATAGCGGGPGAGPDAPIAPVADAPSTPDAVPAVGTPAPAGGWPVSSRCAEESPGGCIAVEAETWDRSGVASLVTDVDANLTQLIDPDGNVVLAIAPPNWFAASGLTAQPDGGWVLAGASLGPGDLHVGADIIVLPDTYNRIIARIDATGVAWAQVVEGASAERAWVAARTDGSIVVGGEQMVDTTLGPYTLSGPVWVFDFFLAAVTADGDWAWAIELPSPASPLGDFELRGLSLGDHSEAIAHGNLRGTVSVAGDTLVGPVTADAVASEAGGWLALVAAP